MKRCKKCGEAKPLSEFYREAACRDGFRPECKSCNLAARKAKYRENSAKEIARVKAWQQANREHLNAYRRRYRAENKTAMREGHLKRTFGLTLDEYDAMVDAQGGVCAICGDSAVEGQSLHVDHYGELVRGALCVRCNNGLGQFKENPELLQIAADYVECGGFVPSGMYADRDLAIARARGLVKAPG